MRYRIRKAFKGGFILQFRVWWWPFWRYVDTLIDARTGQVFPVVYATLADAWNAIESRQTSVVWQGSWDRANKNPDQGVV